MIHTKKESQGGNPNIGEIREKGSRLDHYVWSLNFDMAGLRDQTKSLAPPCIAERFVRTHKPPGTTRWVTNIKRINTCEKDFFSIEIHV